MGVGVEASVELLPASPSLAATSVRVGLAADEVEETEAEAWCFFLLQVFFLGVEEGWGAAGVDDAGLEGEAEEEEPDSSGEP